MGCYCKKDLTMYICWGKGSPVMVFEQRMKAQEVDRRFGVHSVLDLGLTPDPPRSRCQMIVKVLDSSVPQFFLFIKSNLCFWREFNK